jgi:hypothetical protein
MPEPSSWQPTRPRFAICAAGCARWDSLCHPERVFARVVFYGGLFIVAWLLIWAFLIVFGEYLRTDRVAEFLESGEGSLNFVLAVAVSALFIIAVYTTAITRRR